MQPALAHPDKEVVFFAVGSETTTPANAMAVWRAKELGVDNVGRVVDTHPGMVVLRTGLGGTHVVDMLTGDQLPRIR